MDQVQTDNGYVDYNLISAIAGKGKYEFNLLKSYGSDFTDGINLTHNREFEVKTKDKVYRWQISVREDEGVCSVLSVNKI